MLGVVRSQAQTISTQGEQIAALKHQLEWFKRQIFGQKSERFAPTPPPDPMQLYLGEIVGTTPQPTSPPEKFKTVAGHTRRTPLKDAADAAEEVPFFDESQVPVQTIVLAPAEIEGLSGEDYEIIGEKITYRMAQRPGTYQVIRYRRLVVKLKGKADAGKILCLPAPQGVIEGSRADVSLQAGILVDKFAWHLPLYRQHQRMEAGGIRVSRPWLTQIAQQTIALLTPIYEAQLASIRQSRVIAMDETPIKAGRSGHGKMNTSYFWPVHGELDEVCFPFHTSRAALHVRSALGLAPKAGTVLLTDGYAAYTQYAQKTGVTHALCWAHARRAFYEAQDAEPEAVADVLALLRGLYAVEEQIREQKLEAEAKQLHRLTHSKPIVERFFDYVERSLERHGLAPANPFIKALHYVRERQDGLEVFLTDPDVPIDTNHLERALRPIPLGKKNWLFCWTELGAKHVGIIQSLIVTCRLQKIDPYTYLVDVLQRVGEHPASRVEELTPRRWKALFADKPLRSDIHQFPA
ncbi:MAG: IS66 family transposase [Gammaproteobacteria bacterium]|nr:IS66 family transposase [Gammaproteobacteria bacterium]